MIGELVAGLGSVLLDGPILGLLALVAALLLVGFGYGWGRRSALREVDEGRAEVRRACERAAAKRVVVPWQRAESD